MSNTTDKNEEITFWQGGMAMLRIYHPVAIRAKDRKVRECWKGEIEGKIKDCVTLL